MTDREVTDPHQRGKLCLRKPQFTAQFSNAFSGNPNLAVRGWLRFSFGFRRGGGNAFFQCLDFRILCRNGFSECGKLRLKRLQYGFGFFPGKAADFTGQNAFDVRHIAVPRDFGLICVTISAMFQIVKFLIAILLP